MASGDNPPQKPARPVRLRPRKPCPLCSAPSQQKFHPFCSSRCADIDLHRWLGGKYAIPAENPPDFEEMEEANQRQAGERD